MSVHFQWCILGGHSAPQDPETVRFRAGKFDPMGFKISQNRLVSSVASGCLGSGSGLRSSRVEMCRVKRRTLHDRLHPAEVREAAKS